MDRPLARPCGFDNATCRLFRQPSRWASQCVEYYSERCRQTAYGIGKMGQTLAMVMDPIAIANAAGPGDDYHQSLVTKNLLRPAIGESLFTQRVRVAVQRRASGTRLFHIVIC